MDKVRVLRVIEYVGPRSAVERIINNSVKHIVTFDYVTIIGATIGAYPEILEIEEEED